MLLTTAVTSAEPYKTGVLLDVMLTYNTDCDGCLNVQVAAVVAK